MALARSVVSARALSLGSLNQRRKRHQMADFCSALVAGFCGAVDSAIARNIEERM